MKRRTELSLLMAALLLLVGPACASRGLLVSRPASQHVARISAACGQGHCSEVDYEDLEDPYSWLIILAFIRLPNAPRRRWSRQRAPARP